MTSRTKDMPVFNFDHERGGVTIPLPRDFHYQETLRYLTRSPLECLHQVVDGRVYKALAIGSERVVMEICEENGGGKSGPSSLLVRLNGDVAPTFDTWNTVAAYVTDWLDLRTDLSPFYERTAHDPLIGTLVTALRGLRIVGIPDLFEALCWAIIGQQINLTFAYTLKKRFVERFGTSIQTEAHTYWLFPTPEVIAACTINDLLPLQLTTQKATYILTLAHQMASGTLSKHSLLAQGNFPAIERHLLTLHGIGPWTTHYVLMRCFRDPTAFPIGDAALQNALKQLLHRTQKPPADEIKQLFAPWHGWEAYVTFYLWRSLAT